jgi:serine/threonine protein kinase/Tfp pilus assembly protein PilF
MPADLYRARELFLHAVGKLPPEQWDGYVAAACGADAELEQQVKHLLQVHRDAGSFLERPAAALSGTGPFTPLLAQQGFDPSAETAGTVIGSYQLVEPLGEGGMGTVWLAQQSEPVQRQVALKVIKAGMDSRQVIARFEQERQALALMDHPNIAKVHDAGTTASGRPYFVMELVQGLPITKYCDEHRLTPRQRLELFVPVCAAIQHAHQKGIIHRDLKPSNVLIGLYDGQPVVKVIDFGVAKAAGPQLTDKTLVTGVGSLVGTLEYMSPEQAELNNLDVDTRSDVYSLGVLLYELLTGTTPLERKRVKEAGLLEALRIIREEETPRPSTRLSTVEELASIAACRGVEPGQLSGLVRGELDWIVMKCLDKDRDRRYETANALAADLQRYLRDEPVQACPPSSWYRLRKFVRRNRGRVLAAVVVLLALVGGILGTSWGLVQAWEAEAKARNEAKLKEAEAKLKEAEMKRAVQAEHNAKEEADISRTTVAFVQVLLWQADVHNQPRMFRRLGDEPNPNLTLRELLDRADGMLDGSFAKQELVQAAIRYIVGTAYRALGEYSKAQAHLERAIALRKGKLGADDGHTLGWKHALAHVFYEQAKYDQTEAVCLKLLDAYRTRPGADESVPLSLKHTLALAYKEQGKYDQAEKILKELLDWPARLPGDRDLIAICKQSMASLYEKQGKFKEAEPLALEALQGLTAVRGPKHPDTLQVKNNLAWIYHRQKKYALAEKRYKEAIDGQTATLPPDHPSTLTTKQNLADLYLGQKKLDQAEKLFNEVLAARRRKLPPNHPHTLATTFSLGAVYFHQRRYKEAIPLFEKLLHDRKDQLGDPPLLTVSAAFNLAANYREVGRVEEALDLVDEWLPRGRDKYGLAHPKMRFGVEVAHSLYGRAATPAGEAVAPDRAVAFFEDLLAAQTAELGADDADTLYTTGTLGTLYWRLKRYTKSVPLFEQELKARRKKPEDTDDRTLFAAFNLAVNYCDAGRAPEALRVIDEWLPRAFAQVDLDHRAMKFGLVAADYTYRKAGTPDKIEALLRDLAASRKRKDGGDSSNYAGQLGLLGFHLLGQKKLAEAEPVLRECLAIRLKLEPELWTTFTVQSLLGEVLSGQGNYDAAEPLLLRGYEGLKQREALIPREQLFVLPEALKRLVRLYEAWDRPEEAARWRRELRAAEQAAPKAGGAQDN